MPNRALILMLILAPVTLMAQELSCGKGQIKVLMRGKEKIEDSSYCSNKDGTVLVSEACQKKNCLGQLPAVKFDMENDMETGTGTPGFALCRKMKGKPEIISFKHHDKWVSLDRCIFEPASDYVDTGHLFKINSQKLKK